MAVHNQLAMNRLFWRHLSANTDGDWELIVIDNGCSDGSAGVGVPAKTIRIQSFASSVFAQAPPLSPVACQPSWRSADMQRVDLHPDRVMVVSRTGDRDGLAQ